MSENPIRLTVPTSRAWERMKRILFSPFDIGKWFVLGFSAWLATLFEGWGSSGGGGDFSDSGSGENGDPETGDDGGNLEWSEVSDAIEAFYTMTMTWIQDHPAFAMFIAGLVGIVVVFVVVLAWVSCRGKFMFLDNVAWNRALISQPWKEFRRQGNSLFWWSFWFGLFAMLVILAFLGAGAWYALGVLEAGEWTPTHIVTLSAIVVGLLLFAFLMGYIGMLLDDFVVPVMYEYKLSTTEAWIRFLPLHNRRMFRFVLYAIWKLLLGIVAGIAVLVFALGTCCIGLILLAVPYIGAVVLLPMTVFFRSLGPEFLAQFGDEWDVLDNP